MIYLASPYSHPDSNIRQQRYMAAERATAKLLQKGEMIYSPIVHCHWLAHRYEMPTDYNFWANYNHHMLALAESIYVLILDGWRESKGVAGEIEFAKIASIPVFLYAPHTESIANG